MPVSHSYFLFVQILVDSFHHTMKLPTMHIFLSKIIPVISPHNVLQLAQHEMDCSRRVLTAVFFLSLIASKDSHYARLSVSSVCKISVEHLLLQCFFETNPIYIISRASELVGSPNRYQFLLWWQTQVA